MTKEFLASAAFLGAALVSARWAWWRRTTPGLRVLVYHKIGTPPAGSKLKDLWVTPEKFRSHRSSNAPIFTRLGGCPHRERFDELADDRRRFLQFR